MDKLNQQGSAQEVAAAITGAQEILILAHRRPDADAIGSSLGLGLALEKLGKKVTVANDSDIEKEHFFFPQLKKVKGILPDEFPELVIVCDCGGIERVGKEWAKRLLTAESLVNIDHHAPNPAFGTINYIDSEASSTSSMVYKIIKELNVSLDNEIATCLYAGLAGDTGVFRWMRPSPDDFRDAAEFIEAGADPEMIALELYGKVSIEAINLRAEALSNLEFHFDNRVAFISVNEEMCQRHGASAGDAKDLVSLLRYAEGVVCSVFIRHEDDKWSVSFRSDPKEVDVSVVAESLGGGGHPAAAAFRRTGVSIEKLKVQIISALEKQLS